MERNENETHLEKKKKRYPKMVTMHLLMVFLCFDFLQNQKMENIFFIFFKTGHCQVFFLENLFFRNRLPNF